MLDIRALDNTVKARQRLYKYLGVYFVSVKMIKIDILPIMRKFYGSANSILCHSTHVSELTN